MEKNFMQLVRMGSTALLGGLLLVGCAHQPPGELVAARETYNRVSRGPSATYVPAEVHKARESLVLAEQAFADEPTTQKTKDIAYVAQRKALIAEALGTREADRRKRAAAESDFQRTQGTMLQQTQQALSGTQAQLTDAQRATMDKDQRLQQEAAARAAAEQKAMQNEEALKKAQDSLAKLAAVKEDQRGMVITLSGSVLFASNQSVLLPEARTRLEQVAAALLATKERKIVVEGHTDSRGNDMHNQQLSQARAEAVRSYIVQAGYDPDLIVAQGVGKQRPIADNGTAEGRANNRRVELVIQKTGKGD